MESRSRNLFFPIAVIVALFAILYIFAKLFGPIPFNVTSVTTTKTDMFTVNGQGEASAVPDTASFMLGVTKEATTVEAAQKQANDAANAIIKGLKDLGIKEENIQTTDYSITPNYDFSGGSQRITGYTVSQNIEVEVTPIDKANAAIDVGVKNGANMAGGITFKVNDDKQRELEDKARKQAIDDAKEKAQSIADQAGIKLGRIINVQESMNQPGTVFMERSAIAQDAKAEPESPTTLNPGENTVNLTVTLFYETL